MEDRFKQNYRWLSCCGDAGIEPSSSVSRFTFQHLSGSNLWLDVLNENATKALK